MIIKNVRLKSDFHRREEPTNQDRRSDAISERLGSDGIYNTVYSYACKILNIHHFINTKYCIVPI